MPSAILKIDGDTSGIARALGDVRAQAKATEKALAEAFKNAGRAGEESMTKVERVSARLAAQQQRAAKQREQAERRAYNEAERLAQRTVAAYVRAQDQQRRAARATAQVREKAEKESTAVAAAEARKRGLTAEQEARVRQNALERLTKSYEAAERRQTAIAKRETRERERVERRQQQDLRARGGTISQALQSAAGAGGSAIHTAHGQIQDARQSRAAAERQIGNAVRNAGGNAGDVMGARTAVRAFVEDTGISYSDVAAALETGQERGSALEARPGESSSDAVRRALATVRMANAEGIDAGSLVAARGRLGGAGLTGGSLDEAMRYMIHAAQTGSVEVEQIVQQGLPGAISLMGQRVGALGANATDADRQRAALNAFKESVAIQEVGARGGRMAGNTSNTTARLQEFLSTPARQNAILNNIQNAERGANTSTPAGRERAQRLRELRESMFERDPDRTGGAMRMKAGTNPLEFAARLTAATGNASQSMAILAGGGHGNAQSLLANQRGLLTFLGQSLPGGGTAGEAVTAMMNSGGITNETIAEHQRDVESDSLSELTRAQERGANELTNNTNELIKLSNAFANWSAANPLQSTAATAGGGLLAGILGPAVANRVGNWAAGTSVGRFVTGAPGAARAAGASGRAMLGRVGARALGVPALIGSALSAVGAYGGTEQEDVERQRREGAEWERQSGRLSSAAQAAGRAPPTAAEIGAAVAAALRASPVTATVTPTDAAQAASRAPAPGR